MAARASLDPDTRERAVLLAQIVILALWIGAATFFSAVVAPAAFAALPTRELAGALVGRVLPVLFITGGVTAVIALLLEAFARHAKRRRLRMLMLGIVAVACAIAQLGVAPPIDALRTQLSAPLATLPAGSPQRVAFGRLHMMSVAWLAAAMLAGTSAAVLAALTLRPGDAR
jgi:hypothetical protein